MDIELKWVYWDGVLSKYVERVCGEGVMGGSVTREAAGVGNLQRL